MRFLGARHGAEAGPATFCQPVRLAAALIDSVGADYTRRFPRQIDPMNKFVMLCMALLLCTLAACGDQSSRRAERGKPRVAITTQSVMIRRPPAANAEITPDGTLKIDDIALPQKEPTRAKLQLLFGHLQMLRQQAVNAAGADAEYKSIKLTATPEIQTLSGELLDEIPSLQPYRESFGNVQAERH